MKDVNEIYIGNHGDREAGIAGNAFTVSGPLIFQPGGYGDETEAKAALEEFRAALKEVFSLVLDPCEYVIFDFEIPEEPSHDHSTY